MACAPAQQGGTAWQQLIAQLNSVAAQPGNRAEVTKYYTFGGARVAMRQAGNEVFYLAGDHLGSASLVLDWQGRKISEMRYTPWGETRWAWELDGEGYTDKRFASHTTQNSNYTGSLIDYGARSLNPTTGRFISADALVTDPNDPAAYNRYAFVGNNPLRYTDPDGHCWPVCTVIAGAAIGAVVGAGIQVLANAAAGKPLDTDVGKAALIGGVSGAVGGLIPGGGTLAGAIVVGAVSGAVTGQVARAADNVISGRQWDAGLGNVGDIALDATIGGAAGGAGFGVGKVLPELTEKVSSTLNRWLDSEITLYRGTRNALDIADMQSGKLVSKATRSGLEPNGLNTSLPAKLWHSVTSDTPPSQFVSMTSSQKVASSFAGSSGKVFAFEVPRRTVSKAWWNPFEKEYLAKGVTKIFNVRTLPK